MAIIEEMQELKAIKYSSRKLLETLISYINSEHFNVGDRLPAERILSEKFMVSRGSLRKALASLIDMGVIQSKQGAGNYIAKVNVTSNSLDLLDNVHGNSSLFEQILEFRYVFEPALAALAAEKRTTEDINQLKIIACDQQKRLCMEEGDGNLDAKFHLQIAKSTANIVFIETMEKINALYARGREDSLRDKDWRQFSVSSHMRIIDAIENKDRDRCFKELQEHIKAVNENHIFNKNSGSKT